jgi:hypothetical protein
MSEHVDASVLLARRVRHAMWLVLALSAFTFLLALPGVIATPMDRESTIVIGPFQLLPSLTVMLAGILIAAAIPALRFHNSARRVLVAALQLAGFLCLAVLAFMLIIVFQPGAPPFAAFSAALLPGLVLYLLLAALAFSLAYFLTRPRVRALFPSTLQRRLAV